MLAGRLSVSLATRRFGGVPGDPAVLQHVLQGRPLAGVVHQQSRDEVPGSLGHEVGEGEFNLEQDKRQAVTRRGSESTVPALTRARREGRKGSGDAHRSDGPSGLRLTRDIRL